MSRHVVDGGRPKRPHRIARLVAAGACSALLVLPSGAGAAPDGYGYEMVSPPSKSNGGVVFGQRVSDDGNTVAFIMNAAAGADSGAFGFAPYVSHRTPSGWATRPTMAPIKVENRGSNAVSVTQADFTSDYSEAFVFTNDTLDPADLPPAASHDLEAGVDIYRVDIATHAARWISRPVPALAGPYLAGGTGAVRFAGRSLDAEHLFFISDGRLVPEAPDVYGFAVTLYEAAGGEVRLVSIYPDGTPAPARSMVASGVFEPTQSDRGNPAISDDGSRVYWTDENVGAGGLYLREDGTRTLPISESRAAGTAGTVFTARFLAASRDGSIAYFHSGSRLTDDAPGSGGLYRFDRAGEQLTFLAPADVDGPATASDDGSRLYFGATNRVIDGDPDWVDGARNMYLWQGTSAAAGSLSDIGASSFVGADFVDPRLRVSRSGRFAAFTSRLSLVPEHRDGASEIYLYDADTGRRVCASCRQDGTAGVGNAAFRPTLSRYALSVSPITVQPRNLTEDGRLFFQTEEPLAILDNNGTTDVYRYDGGRQTLMSPGRGGPADLVDNSEDGTSVFFTTPDSLVPQDVDGGYPDVYAARSGGGFPLPPVTAGPCQGDTCQGPIAVPPAFGTPGSTREGTDDTLPEAAVVSFRALRPTAGQLRAFARNGRLTIAVRVGGPGSVLVEASGRVGRRQRALGKGWARAARAGTVRVAVPLNRAATSQLARGRALRVAIDVSHSGSDEVRRLTLRLRRPARNARARGAKATDSIRSTQER